MARRQVRLSDDEDLSVAVLDAPTEARSGGSVISPDSFELTQLRAVAAGADAARQNALYEAAKYRAEAVGLVDSNRRLSRLVHGLKAQRGLGQLDQIARFAGGQAIRSVTFRSAFTPPIVMQGSDLFAPGQPAPPPQASSFSLVGLLKPMLTVDTVAGPLQAAPGGVPSENTWLATAIGVGVAGVVVLGVGALVCRALGRR